jgi:hypothetical protein
MKPECALPDRSDVVDAVDVLPVAPMLSVAHVVPRPAVHLGVVHVR